MKKALSYFCAVCVCLFATLSVIVIVIEYCSYDSVFFQKQFQSYDAKGVIGITEAELADVTAVLQGYLRGDVPTLDVEVVRAGERVQFFNEREKFHMIDVLVLFNFARFVKGFSLVAAFGFALLLFVLQRKNTLAFLSKTVLWFVGSVFAIIAAFALVISQNFEKAWNFAHTLDFSNDLWLLDPSTDMLINLVPLEFFIAITARIAILLVLYLIIIAALALVNRRSARRKNASAKGVTI